MDDAELDEIARNEDEDEVGDGMDTSQPAQRYGSGRWVGR